jgi:hypothetical protein
LKPSLNPNPSHLKLGLRRANTQGGSNNSREISPKKNSGVDEDFSINDSSPTETDSPGIPEKKKSISDSISPRSFSPIKVYRKSMF